MLSIARYVKVTLFVDGMYMRVCVVLCSVYVDTSVRMYGSMYVYICIYCTIGILIIKIRNQIIQGASAGSS